MDAKPDAPQQPTEATLQAVIFDVDGTLVDSERHGHRVAFNHAFEHLELPYRWGEDEYGSLLQVTGGKERLRHYLRGQGFPAEQLDETVVALHEEKNRHFRWLVANGRIPGRPGIDTLIAELRAESVRLAVATTGSREWVEPLLAGLFGDSLFEAILTGDDVTHKKPDPEVYEHALDALGLAPGQTVAVEDSLNGVRAAKAAGICCVVVPSEYAAGDDLSEADAVVDGFDEVSRRFLVEVHAGWLAAREASVSPTAAEAGRDSS